jgi:uncharacterized protein (TIGR03083 family)
VDTTAVLAGRARERRAVADLIESLDAKALATPSLCRGWTVHDVAGHLAASSNPDPRSWVGPVLRARGRPHRANDLVAHAMAQRPAAELAGILRRHADNPWSPPLVGPRGPLTDVLVHDGDIRVPLGLLREHAPETLRWALDFVTSGRPVGFIPRGRLEGIRLIAEDLDWSAGEGQPAQGRGIDVLMAACGRRAVLSNLSGTGVRVLDGRLPG